MNKEAERLWEKYKNAFGPFKNSSFQLHRGTFFSLIKDTIEGHDPWVYDREPTREDGDEQDSIFIECKNGSRIVIKVSRYHQFNVKRWMSIPKGRAPLAEDNKA
jgi:hypothetical protein